MRRASPLVFVSALIVACSHGTPPVVDSDEDEGEDNQATHGSAQTSEATDHTGDTGDADIGDIGDGDGDGDGDGMEPSAAPLYPGDRVHSPITAHVVETLQALRAANPDADDALFMKVGDSHTVSANALYCFAGDTVELDAQAAQLGPSLEWFLTGDAAGTTPFDRVTLAAEIGRTAGWALNGSPSPLDQELAALGDDAGGGPSLAMVHYGSNDMEMGLTYASAMPAYYANMSDLLDGLTAIGVVPIVVGVTRRLDSVEADRWVRTYTAVARALAQARELPFVDLTQVLEPLPNYGLGGDGLHLDAFDSGACVLTPPGLDHGNNVRNLLALEALARTRAALIEGEAADLDAPTLVGEGSAASPFEIPGLPFADSRDSEAGPGQELDVYDGCESEADESGPEHIYRLELAAPAAIRALVLDRAEVDVDIHLLDASASEAGCLARDDMLIETTLEPGVYHFALDTYVDGQGVALAGDYSFVLLTCDPGDPDCGP